MTTLKEELKKVARENMAYFNWKFPDTRYDQTLEVKTEEEFLRTVGRKTLNGFLEWEKTPEYSNLVALYLQSKIMNDIHEIYTIVREKALTGDDKSVKLLLQLNKEVNTIVKESLRMKHIDSDEEVDDGLVL